MPFAARLHGASRVLSVVTGYISQKESSLREESVEEQILVARLSRGQVTPQILSRTQD